MGKTYEGIDDGLKAFIEKQHVFFVGSAPSGADGHVNVSPKGLDSLRVLSATQIAYLDFVGSGVETIAHLRENSRICVMFCAFEGPPRIVRLHGRGVAVEPGNEHFDVLRAGFPPAPPGGVRSVIVVDVTRVSDSCGYGVPHLRFEGDRGQLAAWAERKGPDGLEKYRHEKNARSIDGAPALKSQPRT